MLLCLKVLCNFENASVADITLRKQLFDAYIYIFCSMTLLISENQQIENSSLKVNFFSQDEMK